MNPKVSIIAGYYNRADRIKRTLDSILHQTYSDYEFIVFDDHSNDKTSDILQSYKKDYNDNRLKIIRFEKNLGFTAGMRVSIAESKGEYIAIQGAGDVSLPDRILRQAQVLDSDPSIGVVGCWYTNLISSTGVERRREPVADNATLGSLLTQGNLFSHGEVMYRRSIYDLVGGYRPIIKMGQDFDLWLRMIKVTKFFTVKQNLYQRYIEFDGVTYDPQKVPIQTRYSLLTRRLAQMQPEEEATKVLARLETEGIVNLIPTHDRELQKALFRAAMRSAIWGGSAQAQQIAKDNLNNPLTRAWVIFISRIINIKYLGNQINFFRSLFGMKITRKRGAREN